MDNHRVVDLRSAGKVALTDIEVWPLADVAVQAGPVTHVGGQVTLRVVNMQTGRCILIPGDVPWLARLAAMIEAESVQAIATAQQKEAA